MSGNLVPANSPYVRPDATSQLLTYKARLDAAAFIFERMALLFAPSACEPASLKVQLQAGFIPKGTVVLATEVASQQTASLTAPTTNPRKDIVYIDNVTGAVGVVAGTAAGSPVDPTVPAGKLPVARITWTANATAISNSMIEDIRSPFLADMTTTRGDILLRGASGLARKGLGAAGTFLGSDGTDLDYFALATDPPISAQSGDFTAGSSTSNTLYVASAALIATLPAVSACATGFRIRLKNATDGVSVTYAAAGSDTIDGAATFRVPGREEVELTKTAALTWTVTKRPSAKVGETMQWDTNILPEGGWAWKNGQALSRTTYSGLDAVLRPRATVTMTIASPGVVSHVAHGYQNNQPVVLRTSGALPTGLTAGTTYYLVNKATDTYQLSATPGGSAINTTGSQSGVHTANYTAYGDGDGSTTFNVPNEKGKTKVGKDDMGGSSAANLVTQAISGIYGIVLGWIGGDQNIAAHGHPFNYKSTGSDSGTPYPASISTSFPDGPVGTMSSSSNASSGTLAAGTVVGNAGAGTGANMPPTIITNYIVKT